MNLVDSSGWLEYLADGPNSRFFASAIENTSRLLVPTICILEVAKRVLQQRDESDMLEAVALMQQGLLVEVDAELALSAARLGRDHKLALADSIILASARRYDATIWTQDADFEGMDNVRYVRR